MFSWNTHFEHTVTTVYVECAYERMVGTGAVSRMRRHWHGCNGICHAPYAASGAVSAHRDAVSTRRLGTAPCRAARARKRKNMRAGRPRPWKTRLVLCRSVGKTPGVCVCVCVCVFVSVCVHRRTLAIYRPSPSRTSVHNGRSKMNKDKSMNIDTETYKK